MTYFQATPEGRNVEAHNRTLLRDLKATYTFVLKIYLSASWRDYDRSNRML